MRLGRAALYALGATTVTMATACGSSSNTGQGERDSGFLTADAYGTPPLMDSSVADTMGNAHYGAPGLDSGLGPDTMGSAPAYGAPAIDSGMEGDSMGAAPAYGGPPPQDSGMGGALYGGPPQDF
jgi:hypothetical protein